jgi:hypothetical protein
MPSNQERTRHLLDKIQVLREENENELTRPNIKVRNIHLIDVYMSQLQDFLLEETKNLPIN